MQPRKIKHTIAMVAMVAIGFLAFIGVGPNLAKTEEHAGHEAHRAHQAQTAEAINVMLHSEPATVQAGTSAKLTFHLTDANGEPVTDLLVHHARVLHVLIVSENLGIIGHIHPEDFDTRDMMEELEGRYTVHFTFPAAGRYILAVDVMTAAAEFAKYVYVNVTGEPKMEEIARDFRTEKTALGYTDEGGDRYTKAVSVTDSDADAVYHVKMDAPDRIQAGKMVHIAYHFSREGKPITALVPFLDAPMHFAIVSTRLDGIIHTHGIVPGSGPEPHAGHKMMTQQKEPAAHAGHEAPQKAASGGHQHHGALPETFGPTVNLMTTFPQSGIYQIFGQLKHENQIIWLSFMVEVE